MIRNVYERANIALLFWLLAQSVPGFAMAPSEVYRRAAPSVVVVLVFDSFGDAKGFGSGVVVARDRVITNCHVTDEGAALFIERDAERTPARVIERDNTRDLCLLQARTGNAPAARMRRSDELQIGEEVFAIGTPGGLEQTLSPGLISQFRTLDGWRLIQTTAPISPGSSGGGLFDEAAMLVGITIGQYKDGQNLNFAVPIDSIDDLLQRGRRAQEARLAEEKRHRAQTAGSEIPLLSEEPPPVGSGTLLSNAQLRYCLAQSIRISAVRPLLDRTKVEQVEYLNDMVAEFNKRCASQRYPVPAFEEAKRVVEANRPVIEAEARRRAEEVFLAQEKRPPAQAAAILEEQKKVAAAAQQRAQEEARKRQAAEARGRELELWHTRIHDRIKSKVVVLPGIPSSARAEYLITVIPGGDVLTIRLRQSSGYPAWDAAVERAINAASPLPVPSDPDLFAQMRELTIGFRPD